MYYIKYLYLNSNQFRWFSGNFVISQKFYAPTCHKDIERMFLLSPYI